MKKAISLIMCIVIVLSTLGICAFAETKNSPRFTNVGEINTVFNIDSNGNARVTVSYDGYSAMTHATIKIKIQKQFLFFFWTDVIEWTDESTERYYAKTFTTPVDGGTYKAIVEYTIRGTAGEPDVITDEIQRTY